MKGPKNLWIGCGFVLAVVLGCGGEETDVSTVPDDDTVVEVTTDDQAQAEDVAEELTEEACEAFCPLYESCGWEEGFRDDYGDLEGCLAQCPQDARQERRSELAPLIAQYGDAAKSCWTKSMELRLCVEQNLECPEFFDRLVPTECRDVEKDVDACWAETFGDDPDPRACPDFKIGYCYDAYHRCLEEEVIEYTECVTTMCECVAELRCRDYQECIEGVFGG